MARKALTLRLEPETYEALVFITDQSGESMNAFVTRAVARELDRTNRELQKSLESTLAKLKSMGPQGRAAAAAVYAESEGVTGDPADGQVVDMTAEAVRTARQRSIRTEIDPQTPVSAGRRPALVAEDGDAP